MIRTAEAYRRGLRDGREVWIDNERVKDVTAHPAVYNSLDFNGPLDFVRRAAFLFDNVTTSLS